MPQLDRCPSFSRRHPSPSPPPLHAYSPSSPLHNPRFTSNRSALQEQSSDHRQWSNDSRSPPLPWQKHASYTRHDDPLPSLPTHSYPSPSTSLTDHKMAALSFTSRHTPSSSSSRSLFAEPSFSPPPPPPPPAQQHKAYAGTTVTLPEDRDTSFLLHQQQSSSSLFTTAPYPETSGPDHLSSYRTQTLDEPSVPHSMTATINKTWDKLTGSGNEQMETEDSHRNTSFASATTTATTAARRLPIILPSPAASSLFPTQFPVPRFGGTGLQGGSAAMAGAASDSTRLSIHAHDPRGGGGGGGGGVGGGNQTTSIDLIDQPRRSSTADPSLKYMSHNVYTGMYSPSTSVASATSPPPPPPSATIFRNISARGTPKGPLPIEVQINLLRSVLKHDPFNCPIRRTTQAWECIAREQGIRARTCARRYDNIVQSSISGRDRPAAGTEEQLATKKKLMEQLLVMMNQPQALLRMQKKRRYRSEEADRKLLVETIRQNPFAQKVGQVAKAWEDVRDALDMKVHARQCIRRVNRMVKPYLLRERMYKGNIPEEMREMNDDLVKQVIQLMDMSGNSASLEDDGGNSNDDDSASVASDSEDIEDGYPTESGQPLRERDELQDDPDEVMTAGDSAPAGKRTGGVATMENSFPLLSIAKSITTKTESTEMTLEEGDKKSKSLSASSASGQRVQSGAEFKPQRLFGSHPYHHPRDSSGSAPRSSSFHASQTHRKSYRTSSSSTTSTTREADEEGRRPSKYLRSSDRPSIDGSESRRASGSGFSVKSPFSEQAYPHTFPSPASTSKSSTGSISGGPFSWLPEPHQSRENSMPSAAPAATASPTPELQPLYRTILNEFHAVRGYLVQLDGQRQRDKENQKALYNIMERVQKQVQQQQQCIEDIQQQLKTIMVHDRYHGNETSSPQLYHQRYHHQQQQPVSHPASARKGSAEYPSGPSSLASPLSGVALKPFELEAEERQQTGGFDNHTSSFRRSSWNENNHGLEVEAHRTRRTIP